jgi:serine/threonine protein kinase
MKKIDNELYKLLELHFKGKIIDEKSGNSGSVYIVDKGENNIPRYIAFKSIKFKYALDKEKQKQFVDECQTWFKIKNRYVITPFYPVVLDGQPYIAMPFCSSDLKSFIINQEIDYPGALSISIQIIKALMVLKTKGIEHHQDLNPPNILLIDIQSKTQAYTKDPQLNFEVRISDFGIANLINKLGPTLGGGGGKFPFKAPEQYDSKKYSSYNPDIFSLGVIIYMLLTGTHPNGMSKTEALNKNTSGNKFKTWAFSNPKIDFHNAAIKKVLNDCFKEDPSERPRLSKIYEIIFEELKKSDKNLYEHILLKFQYYDAFDDSFIEFDNLFDLKNISELPNKRKEVLSQLLTSLEVREFDLKNGKDVIIYCETFKTILQIAKRRDLCPEFILGEAFNILSLLKIWNSQIKAADRYPSVNIEDHVILSSPKIWDYEVSSEYVFLAMSVMDKFKGVEYSDSFFEKCSDKPICSMYYYNRASIARNTDIILALKYLDKAKLLMKNQPVFYYMEHTWIEGFLTLDEIFKKLSVSQKKTLKSRSKRAFKVFSYRDPR